jgi:hypothetical protein
MVPKPGGVQFINDRTGLCLDVAGARTGGNDAPLTLYTCADNDDHIWVPRPGATTSTS